MTTLRRTLLAATGTTLLLSACSGVPGAKSAGDSVEKTLTLGFTSDITGRSVDPAVTSGGTAIPFLYSVYDTLFKFDANGQPQPNLATSSELSADKLTLTLKLKSGVTFQDGSPLDSEDVKFSLDRDRGADSTLEGPTTASALAAVTDVTAPDPTTVVIKLSTPVPIMPNLLAYYPGMVVPSDYVKKVGNDGFLKAPVGSGPYQFVSATQGQKLSLKAFANYQGTPKPAYNKVDIKVLKEQSARLAALRSGDIDFALDVDVSQVDSLKASGFTVKTNPPGQRLMLLINSRNPALKDSRVRQALNMAVNDKAIVDTLFKGNAAVASSPDPTVTTKDVPAFPFDAAKAKQFLTEANFNFAEPLTLDYPAGNFPQGDLIVQAVQGDLAAVGVKIKLRPLDSDAWAKALNDKTAGDLSLTRIGNTTYDSYQYLSDNFVCNGPFSLLCDKALETRLKEISILSGTERRTAFVELAQKLHDDPPAVYLVDPYQLYAMAKNVEWQPTPGIRIYSWAQIRPVS